MSTNPSDPSWTSEITSGPAEPFALPATTGVVVGTGPGSYLGYSLKATTTAAVVLTDGATGPVLDEISIAASGVSNANYDRPGREVENEIYATITGTPSGSVFQ